ncbi:hypothetical protein CHU98_g12544 [Xylaria longipes]|nr:hypothetical protein CHU98_g12544 [Xylaria longipes]
MSSASETVVQAYSKSWGGTRICTSQPGISIELDDEATIRDRGRCTCRTEAEEEAKQEYVPVYLDQTEGVDKKGRLRTLRKGEEGPGTISRSAPGVDWVNGAQELVKGGSRCHGARIKSIGKGILQLTSGPGFGSI